MKNGELIIFPILIITARPAAGKSEIIQYLQNLDAKDRKSRFHIGNMHVIDDFPMLWTWFEEDDLLTKMGYSRIHTDENGYFLDQYQWDLLIERMGLDYSKFLHDIENGENYTIIFEFSRGKEHGGYKSAFTHIPESILNKSAIIYVNVSWEESLRKNRKRFNPEKPGSILEHSLPDEKLARLYKETDWHEFSAKNSKEIYFGQTIIPYAIIENEDDVTSGNNIELGKRLKNVLSDLWERYKAINHK